MNSMKRQKDKTLEDEAPGLKGFTVLLGNAAKSLQSCQTLYDPIDGSPPGSAISGILQARTLILIIFNYIFSHHSFTFFL